MMRRDSRIEKAARASCCSGCRSGGTEMDHRDALAPLIELVGVFAGSAASPSNRGCHLHSGAVPDPLQQLPAAGGSGRHVRRSVWRGHRRHHGRPCPGNAGGCCGHPSAGVVRLAGRVRHEEHRRCDRAAVRPGLKGENGLKSETGRPVKGGPPQPWCSRCQPRDSVCVFCPCSVVVPLAGA